MPSYRYTRNIKPEDLLPDTPAEYSKKQKTGNWWHYHWKAVALAAVALTVAVSLMVSCLRREKPDMVIGILTPNSLPAAITEALAAELSAVTDDLNGDGKALVWVDVYTVDLSAAVGAASQQGANSADGMMSAADPYTQMAGVTRLAAAFETGEVMIFLADSAQAKLYQEAYRLFAVGEGRLAGEEDVDDITVPYSALAALKTKELMAEPMEGYVLSGREVLKDYRVGLRAFYGTGIENNADAAARWAAASALLERLKTGDV